MDDLQKIAWTGLNTGMHIQVQVRMQLCVPLWGPQSLVHYVGWPRLLFKADADIDT